MRKLIGNMQINRTDMAVEFRTCAKAKRQFGVSSRSVKYDFGVDETVVELKSHNSLGRERGRYVTFDAPFLFGTHQCEISEMLQDLIKKEIRRLSKGSKNVLIVGVGNDGLTSDSLGPKTLEKVQISRSFDGTRIGGVAPNVPLISKVSPNVLGNTGIESFDIVEAVVDKIKPDLLIVVDSLCARSVSRVGQSFQISTAGIQPGSGVGNRQKELSVSTLNVPVVAIGVPMVVQTFSLFNDLFADLGGGYDGLVAEMWGELQGSGVGELVVTPKEVDYIVETCANIIAKAINTAFFG